MPENPHPDLERMMMQPGFYPHPADNVKRIETVISVVFLAGEFAYKIKKPIALEFLDFSSLENRRLLCCEEVRLNRRLTDGIYLGVIAVTREGDRLVMNGAGDPVEYAVKMRRIEDRYTMSSMLAKDLLGNSDFKHLADRLAEFYQTVPVRKDLGGPATVTENCMENFRQMRQFVGRDIDSFTFNLINTATNKFLKHRARVFEKRLHEQRIREGHGDLRAEHIYFTPKGIQVLDCIEFNERMRVNDIASEIAFLCMDLDHQGHYCVSEEMLSVFVSALKDPGIFSLIDFYLCYRACVRLKVTCFRLEQKNLNSDQSKLLSQRVQIFSALACRYAKRFIRPTVYVVMGMIASGKSTLARALAEAIDAKLLSSDLIRKKLFKDRQNNSLEESFGKGAYSSEERSRVYDQMLQTAQQALLDHQPVILDATFSREKHRSEVVHMAWNRGAQIVFIECLCPERVLRARLAEREKGGSISDARLSILDDFRKNYSPPEEISKDLRFAADTTRQPQELISDLFISSRRIYTG